MVCQSLASTWHFSLYIYKERDEQRESEMAGVGGSGGVEERQRKRISSLLGLSLLILCWKITFNWFTRIENEPPYLKVIIIILPPNRSHFFGNAIRSKCLDYILPQSIASHRVCDDGSWNYPGDQEKNSTSEKDQNAGSSMCPIVSLAFKWYFGHFQCFQHVNV